MIKAVARDYLTICMVAIPALTAVAVFNPVTWYSVAAMTVAAVAAKLVTR